MASAGTVTLNLDANSVKLMRELQKAQRQTRASSGAMAADFQRAFSRIAKASAVAVTAVAGAMTMIYRSQSKVIDELGKTSDALGVQTERLQALRHVANLTGVGAEALSTNMQRMQRSLGQIARSGGPAEKALKDIGLNINDLINLSADRQLEAIARAMSGVENAALRASIASDLFGRDGARMMNMLDQLNKDGLDPVVELLDRLGLSMSRLDVARLEKANDAMFTAKQVFTGVFQRLSINMSVFVAYFAEAFTDMAMNTDMLGENIDRMFDRVILGAIDVYEAITSSLDPIFRIIKSLWDGFTSLPAWVQEVGIVGAIVGGAKGRIALAAIAASAAALNATVGIPEWMKVGQDFSAIGAVAGFLSPETKSAMDSDRSWLRETYEKIMAEKESFGQRFEARKTGTPVIIGGDDDIEKINQFSKFGEQAARNLQNHFAQFLFDPFKDGLRGMAEGFINTLRKMMAEAASAKILGALLGGFAGSANPLLAGIGSAFGGSMDSGGRGSAGKAYLIGRGAQPEMFIPDTAGTFVPNADQMGGTSLTINVDARDVGAEARIRDMINREMAPQIIAAARGSTIAAMRRPRFA
jgi:hypothetical protein